MWGEPAAVPVVPCSERCSGLAGERLPWQLLSLMNKVCFLMNGQNPELRGSRLWARRAVTLGWVPREGRTTPHRAVPSASAAPGFGGICLNFSLLLAVLGEPGAMTSLSGPCVVHGLGEAAVSPHTPALDRGTKAWAATLEIAFQRADPLEKAKFLLDFAPFNPVFPAGFYSIITASQQHRPSLSHNGWDPIMLLPQLGCSPLCHRHGTLEKMKSALKMAISANLAIKV